MMTSSFTLRARTLFPAFLFISLLAVHSAAARQNDERARLDEIARIAAQQFVDARSSGTPEIEQTRPTVPPPAPGMRIDLTLADAVQRALERNLDISVERLNPQTFDFSIAALQANYRPNFTSNPLPTFGRSVAIRLSASLQSWFSWAISSAPRASR